MTTSTFYPTASGDDGMVRSECLTTVGWAAAQDGYDLTLSLSSNLTACSRHYKGTGNNYYYRIWHTYIQWDTSSIPDSDTVTSATFSAYATTIQHEYDDTHYLRAYDWGGTIDTGDWRNDTQAPALTELASAEINGFTLNAYNAFTSHSNFLAAINKTGYTRVIHYCDSFTFSTPPSSQSDSLAYSSYDDGTNLPKLVVEHASGGLSAAPGLITTTPSTYAPTVVPGNVDVSPGLITVTPTVYAPTAVATQSVTPGLITASPTTYTPSVVPGNVDVAPPLITASPTALAPEVLPGGVAVEPGLISATPTVYAPQVNKGVSAPLVAVSPTLYSPTVVPGPVSVEPGLVAVAPSVLAPTVVPGPVSVEVGLITTTPSVLVPTVLPGGVAVEPGLVTATPAVYAPEVQPGPVSVEVGLIAVTPAVYAPVVTTEGGPQNISVPVIATVPSVYAPTVVPGGVVAEPALITTTPTLYAPSIAQAVAVGLITASPTVYAPAVAQTIGVGRVETAPTLYTPTLLPGQVAVSPGLVEVSPTVYVPTVVPGGVPAAPPLVAVAPVLYAPTISVGPVAVDVGLVVVTPALYAPTIIAGAGYALPPLVSVTPALFAPMLMQTARPDADVTDGGWTNELGSNVDLYASLDEPIPSDDDYCKSGSNPSADMMEVGLASLTDPLTSGNHKVLYRIGKDEDVGTVDVTVKLVQGSTVIATWVHYNVAVGWTDYEQTLTNEQADAITDYTDLRLRVEADS